jgi:hypothetical protein
MTSDDMRKLIEIASGAAEKLFHSQGFVRPMWHMVTADGEHLVTGAIFGDKDTDVAMIKALMVLRHVVRFVFVDEAWIIERSGNIDRAELTRIGRHGLKDHPERKEILLFSAEDQGVGMLTARRDIIRDRGRKARLSPLVIEKQWLQSEGRMVGLLPPLGTRQ